MSTNVRAQIRNKLSLLLRLKTRITEMIVQCYLECCNSMSMFVLGFLTLFREYSANGEFDNTEINENP